MMEFVGFDEQIPSSRVKQLKRSAEPYLNNLTPMVKVRLGMDGDR